MLTVHLTSLERRTIIVGMIMTSTPAPLKLRLTTGVKTDHSCSTAMIGRFSSVRMQINLQQMIIVLMGTARLSQDLCLDSRDWSVILGDGEMREQILVSVFRLTQFPIRVECVSFDLSLLITKEGGDQSHSLRTTSLEWLVTRSKKSQCFQFMDLLA
jgi:hypothetical protein